MNKSSTKYKVNKRRVSRRGRFKKSKKKKRKISKKFIRGKSTMKKLKGGSLNVAPIILTYVTIDLSSIGVVSTGNENIICNLIQSEINKVVPIEDMKSEDENTPTYFITFIKKTDLLRVGYVPGSNPDHNQLTEYIWLIALDGGHSGYLWTDTMAGKGPVEGIEGDNCFLKWINYTINERICILFEMDNKNYYENNSIIETDIQHESDKLLRSPPIEITYDMGENLGIKFLRSGTGSQYPKVRTYKPHEEKFNPKSNVIPADAILIKVNGKTVTHSIRDRLESKMDGIELNDITLEDFKQIVVNRNESITLTFSPMQWNTTPFASSYSPLGPSAGFDEACYLWKIENDLKNICARRGYSGNRSILSHRFLPDTGDRSIDAYIFTREAYNQARLKPILCVDVS